MIHRAFIALALIVLARGPAGAQQPGGPTRPQPFLTVGNLGLWPIFDAIDSPVLRVSSKVVFIQQLAPDWVKNGGDGALLQSMMAKIDQYASAGQYEEANKSADAVLALLGAKDANVPKATVQLHRTQREALLNAAGAFALSGIEDYVGWGAVDKDPHNWDVYREDAATIRKAGYSFIPYLWIQTLPAWVKTDPAYVFAGNVATGLEIEALSIFAPQTLSAYDRFFGEARRELGAYADIVRIGSPYDYGETAYPAGGASSSFPLKNMEPGFWVNEAPARSHFRNSMRSKYASIEDLNRAWGTSFPNHESADYPKDNKQPRYWLDFVSWYHVAFTERMGEIAGIAQKHFPGTPINFNLGWPFEKINLGQDITGLLKMAGKKHLHVRTPTGPSVPFLYTKRVATAARHYGPTGFSSEPVDGSATCEQMALAYFKDLSTGVKWHFDYGKNYERCPQSLADHRAAWDGAEYPRVEAALFFPTTSHYLDNWDAWRGEGLSGGFPGNLAAYAEDLRDMLDYDVVDERLVSDGYLDAYRFLIWPVGMVAESPTLERIGAWVKKGGILLAANVRSIRSVEGAAAVEDLLAHPTGAGVWQAGKGTVIEISNDPRDLETKFPAELDARDGVLVSRFTDRLLLFNRTGASVAKTVATTRGPMEIILAPFQFDQVNAATEVPAGGLIALTLKDQNGRLQIFTITPDGGNRKQLTFEGENGRPDWSPDGTKLTYMSAKAGGVWVAVMDADGSNQKILTAGVSPDWSPDGKRIAFARPALSGSEFFEIWTINTDGSGARQITHTAQPGPSKIGPSWSPDGKQMVYISIANPTSRSDPQPNLGIMNSDGTNERLLTTSDRTNVRINPDGSSTVCETAHDMNAPAWSPVDNRIAFWSGIETQYGQVWVINSDGTGSKQLTEDCSHRNSDDPSWSPDGRKILFSTGRSGRPELWVMDADGSNEQRVSDIDVDPFPGRATWQPLPAKMESRREWEPDRRLTSDGANSRLAINFARSMAIDGNGGVHAVWFDDRVGANRIYYRRSENEGADWQPEIALADFPSVQEMPAIAASASSVYVVWQDTRDGGLSIYFKRSADGGRTWFPELRLSSSGGSAYASVAASGSNVYVVWGDNRDGQAETYVRASTDGGITWGPGTLVSETPWDSWVPTIAAAGDKVYVAWVDTQDGNEEEYFRRSTDRGMTWEPVQRLTTNDANSWAPTLAVAGDTVHLVWFDQKDSPVQPFEAENKLNGAMDLLGLKYELPPRGVVVPNPEELAKRRATEKLELIYKQMQAWIAGGGDESKLRALLNALEALGSSGAPYIVKEMKVDEAVALMGLTYSPGPLAAATPKIDQPQARAMRIAASLWRIRDAAPGWAAKGGDSAVLERILREFQKMYDLASSEWEVYYMRSTDHGATWQPASRLTYAPGSSQRPSITASGKRLFVSWFDSRDGNSEVYFKESADRGESWGPDERLTTAQGESVLPTIAAGTGRVHIVWSDTRDGNPEIYYKRSK